jgi:UDP-glucose 4-epimerase
VSRGPADVHAPAALQVLITGGSGFIGRHVVALLKVAGHHVRVADLDGFPDKSVDSVTGDLCDRHVREDAVTSDIDAVVHLANAVVGDIGQRTITEDLPLAPLTPYGGTKAAAEMLLYGYAGAFGLRTPVVRLTNVYGPGMAHKDSFVPRLMRAAACGGEVQIYGDGEQRRDLVHVGDAARAMVLAVLSWPTGPVIIGGSRSYTVNEIAQVARDTTGRAIAAERVAPKPGEMPAVVVDIARARSRGFQPSVSLVDGMRSAWADFAPSPDGHGSVDARD